MVKTNITHLVCDIMGTMPYRKIAFTNGSFYHVFNRGVEKRKIFSTNQDRNRFLDLITSDKSMHSQIFKA